KHHLAAALDVAEQPLALAQWKILRLLEQRTRGRQCFGVALFEEPRAQLPVEPRALGAELLDRRLRLFLESGVPPEHVIEATRDFARKLDVGNLILAYRHLARAIDKHIRALQQWIPEKAVSREVLLGEFQLLILVCRDAFQPTDRRDHGKQEVQLRVLRYAGLDKQYRLRRIHSRCKPIDDHFPYVLLD